MTVEPSRIIACNPQVFERAREQRPHHWLALCALPDFIHLFDVVIAEVWHAISGLDDQRVVRLMRTDYGVGEVRNEGGLNRYVARVLYLVTNNPVESRRTLPDKFC